MMTALAADRLFISRTLLHLAHAPPRVVYRFVTKIRQIGYRRHRSLSSYMSAVKIMRRPCPPLPEFPTSNLLLPSSPKRARARHDPARAGRRPGPGSRSFIGAEDASRGRQRETAAAWLIDGPIHPRLGTPNERLAIPLCDLAPADRTRNYPANFREFQNPICM